MSEPEMYLRKVPYEIFKPLQKNCRFLIPDPRTRKMLRRCVAIAAAAFKVTVHDFCFLPDGVYFMMSMQHEDADIPGFMACFCNHTWRFLNVILGRSGPIWRKIKGRSFERRPLLTAAEVLRTHAKFRLETLRMGYSKNNNIFGGMILSLKRIGSKKKIVFRKPCEDRGFSKLDDFFELCHPLSPSLKKFGAKKVRKLVRQLIKVGRAKIYKERRKRKKKAFEEEAILVYKKRATPRTTKERVKRGKYEVQFDFDELMKHEDIAASLEEHGEYRVLKRAFLKQYRKALYSWKLGNYAVPFPEGTYKMVRLFKANVEPVDLGILIE